MERRLQKVLEEGAAPGSILFIDNVQRMVQASGSNLEIVNVIKFAVGRGELQIIGATTPSHYGKTIDAEAAREWYLQVLELKQSSLPETVAILEGVKARFEAHHQLLIPEEVVNVAAHLAARYGTGRFLPGKALELMDEASSHVRTHYAPVWHAMHELTLQVQQVRKQKEAALADLRFEEALELRYREAELMAQVHKATPLQLPQVTLEDVAGVVATRTGMAVDALVDEERARLAGGAS